MSSSAKEAFERGDFAEVRRLAREAGADEETKALAAKLGYDKVIIYITIACVVFFALISALVRGR